MEANRIYGSAWPPCWTGSPVWIVGGGASAQRFDFSRIARNHRILAVNDSVHRFSSAQLRDPRTVACCSIDNAWVRRHRLLLAEFPGEKYVAVPLETWPDCAGIPGVTYLRRTHATGLSDDPAYLCGTNSGYAAINLAYLKGAQDIHLIGFDMDPLGNDIYRWWAPLFRDMLPQLDRRGVRVCNHNRHSAIDAFPKVGPTSNQ